MFGLFKKKEVEKPKEEEWVTRHKNKARVYAETHKAGTRVAAESKNGTWKEGEIIGEHDWALFTFFFTVKFDDGEIIPAVGAASAAQSIIKSHWVSISSNNLVSP